MARLLVFAAFDGHQDFAKCAPAVLEAQPPSKDSKDTPFQNTAVKARAARGCAAEDIITCNSVLEAIPEDKWQVLGALLLNFAVPDAWLKKQLYS